MPEKARTWYVHDVTAHYQVAAELVSRSIGTGLVNTAAGRVISVLQMTYQGANFFISVLPVGLAPPPRLHS